MSFSPLRIAAALLGLALAPVRAETFETLHFFDQSEGKKTVATMTVGPDGNIYGVASEGGTIGPDAPGGAGTIFRYLPATDQFEVVHRFDPATTGRLPTARLLNIGDGFLYGATEGSTTIAGSPAGRVFQLDPATGAVTVLFDVPGGSTGTPKRPVALTSGEPNVLQVLCYDPPGIWRIPLDGSVRTSFSIPGNFGRSLIRGSDGFLYGATEAGGADGLGTLFRAKADGSGAETLYECFKDDATNTRPEGVAPRGAMAEAPDGNFYGMMSDNGIQKNKKSSNGVIYRLTPDGDYSVVLAFPDLRYPFGDMLLATDGLLYGTTQLNPTGVGGVFRINPTGAGYKVVAKIDDANGAVPYPNGREPYAGLVQGPDGNLYGSTFRGGKTAAGAAADNGTLFRVKLNLPQLPANRPPVAIGDAAQSTGSPVDVAVLANDFDPDRDLLEVSITTAPAHGAAEVLAGGTVRYTPNETYVDRDVIGYQINDRHGGKATATVKITNMPVPAAFAAGTYYGLIYLNLGGELTDVVPRAQFNLTAKTDRRFTGVMITQRKRVAFRGTFDDQGQASVKVTLPGRKAATLFLGFYPGTPSTLNAAVYGPDFWTGFAGPVRASGLPKKQAYTVLFTDSSENMPAGYGYGVMKLQPNGAVTVTGKLGDGSPLSWKSSLISVDDEIRAIPFFSEPVPGGAIAAVVAAGTDPGTDFSGVARWLRPTANKPTKPYALGFNGQTQIIVGKFTAPAAQAPVLDLPGGQVEVGPTAKGTFTLVGKKITPTTPLKSLSFNRANGLFSGKILKDGKSVPFTGVLNQGLKAGAGQFKNPVETGGVVLQAETTTE